MPSWPRPLPPCPFPRGGPAEHPLENSNRCPHHALAPYFPRSGPRPVLLWAVAQDGKKAKLSSASQGTTGSPKGATLSHHNIVNNSNMIGQRLRMPLKVSG